MNYGGRKDGYKLGFKEGQYIAQAQINSRMLKDILDDEKKHLIKRANWLSNYEQKLLYRKLLDVMGVRNKVVQDEGNITEAEIIAEILKLLR